MLGLGSSLVHSAGIHRFSMAMGVAYVDAAGLLGRIASKTVFFVTLDEASSDFCGRSGVAAWERVPNLVANCTITRTHGADGVDITDVSETLDLNCYAHYAGTVGITLTDLDAEILPDEVERNYALNLMTISSGSLAADGDDNEYTFVINYLSYPSANNSQPRVAIVFPGGFNEP